MCSFVGFVNLNKDISKDTHIIQEMNNKLQKKYENEKSYYKDTNINLGHIGLKSESNNEKQPMSVRYNDTTYTIVHNGNIYNKNEIKKELKELGYEFQGDTDTEILLKSFIEYGSNILKKLNGTFSFAIWNNKSKELYLVRDQFGIKPLYYTVIDNTIVFATEVKALLCFPKIEVIINKQGICELFGLRTGTYTRSWNI